MQQMTELDRLMQEKIQVQLLEIQMLKQQLSQQQHIEQKLNVTLKLQQDYQEKLKKLNEELNTELSNKNNLIQYYQQTLSQDRLVPDWNDLIHELKPVFQVQLQNYLASSEMIDQIRKEVQKEIGPYLSSLQRIDLIDFSELMNYGENYIKELQEMSRIVRGDVIRMLGEAKSGHPGGSLSCVDILTTLYFAEMDNNPQEKPVDRDRCILSKGHAAPAL